MTSSQNKVGAALVTNTMVAQAARFVDNPSNVVLNPLYAFFDLCMLVEAVILRKHLYTLEGNIVGYSTDVNSHSLASMLSKEGILRFNEVPLHPADVQRELLAIAGSDRVFNHLNVSGLSVRIVDMIPEVFPDETDGAQTANGAERDRLWFMLAVEHPKAAQSLKHSSDAFIFFRGNDFLNFLRGTGSEERGAYALRTYLYSHSAWKERLSFIPDYPRIPFLDSVLSYMYESVVTTGYQLFAKKLGYEAEDFLADARPLGLPIPPFTALLLKRCGSRADLGLVLLEMREEFTKLRENLAQLEEERLHSTNIGERNKHRAHVEAIFAATSRRFDRNNFSTFKELVSFAGDAASPIYNPLSPSSYKTGLLTKPVEWIRDWWFRRPLAQLFDVAAEFRSINEYNNLCRKVFGVEFSEAEIEGFRRAQAILHDMFPKRKETPDG